MKGIQWHPNRDINVSSESAKKWILFSDIIQEVDILTQDCWEWHFMALNVLIVSFFLNICQAGMPLFGSLFPNNPQAAPLLQQQKGPSVTTPDKRLR